MAGYRGYKGDKTRTFKKLYGYKKLSAWLAAEYAGTDADIPFSPPEEHPEQS